jgi:large subunit ribosomal protein L9
MEVILKQDIDRIGKAGSVIKVKDGYARNFLIPNGLAMPVTTENLKQYEQQKQQKSLQFEKIKKEAQILSEKLSGLSLTIPALTQEGDENKLYGGISAVDLAKALEEEGFKIDKSFIALNEPIKSLGIYEIPVKLHPDVSAKIKVWIVKK